MKTTADYLDALRVHYGVKSDYALSGILGIAAPHISRYRKLQGAFGEEWSLKIAEILQIDPAEILLDMQYQREKNESAKLVWQRLASMMQTKEFAGATAALLVFALFPMVSVDPDHFNLAFAGFTASTFGLTDKALYIMSNRIDTSLSC